MRPHDGSRFCCPLDAPVDRAGVMPGDAHLIIDPSGTVAVAVVLQALPFQSATASNGPIREEEVLR